MKRFIIPAVLALLALAAASPARALTAGDIAIIGMNCDDPDAFAFVALVELPAGEVIHFTDNGWIPEPPGFRSGEGTFDYTVPAGGVIAGAIVVVDPSSGMTFSASGDQILAYQGSASMPVFLYALNNEGSGWQAAAGDPNESGLPAGLVDGVSAVAVSETDNIAFDTAVLASGSKAQWLAAISNPANWKGSQTVRQAMPSGTLNVGDPVPQPAVAITDPAADTVSVANDVDHISIAGTSAHAVGDLIWTNTLAAVGGHLAASMSWSIPALALAVGGNPVTVSGTNALGMVASDSLTVIRLAPGLAPGSVALIGWDDTGDDLALVALTELPAGTVLYFTDNGWTGSQYRGASLTDGDGSEDILKLEAIQDLPAGTILRSTDSSPAFVWTNSGTVPGTTSSFSDLALAAGGDQIAVFQGPPSNPLYSPGPHLFVLDDTGAFEPATDTATGGIPPGLVAGRTAVTFDQNGTGESFMAFTNYPGRSLRKTEWLTAIADPANWEFGASGTLPSGTFTVLPPPLLTALSAPADGGTVSGGGRYDAGTLVQLTATAAPAYHFTRWEDGSKNPVRGYLMPANDTAVTASFGWKGTVIIFR